MSEKYGFVYVWYDCWRKMFYVGCHWGTEDDGYICSSDRMRKAYRRRPEDFKRRVVFRTNESRQTLLDVEDSWLKLIKEHEIGKKYYNLRVHKFGHWSAVKDLSLSVNQKLSRAHKGYHRSPSTEFKKGQRISPSTEFQKGVGSFNSGKTLEEQFGKRRASEIKNKMSKTKKGKPLNSPTKFKPGQPSWNKGLKRTFITNGYVTKALYGDDISIPEGWRNGMKSRKAA
jgi:hypothetical protein